MHRLLSMRRRRYEPGSSAMTRVLLFLLMLFALGSGLAMAQEDDECLACHGERDFVGERDGRRISLYVNADRFAGSVHAEIGCASCHMDATAEHAFEDDPRLAPVDCSMCHDEAVEEFNRSLHGVALSRGRYLAPTCVSCHGKHDILPHTDTTSKTYVRNIPSLCGSCHKEGTEVSELRTIAEHHVLEDYSESIHGDGLFKRGLIVTAVCTSCHTSHSILPHEDTQSSINRNKIADTCMNCHAQIEQVHTKVIRGELWERRPHEIPSCIECHQPHKIRRVFYEESYPDRLCVSCHSDENLTVTKDGETRSLYVDASMVENSVHSTNACVKCHTNVSQARDPVCLDSGPVDCSMCHAEQVEQYEVSHHNHLRVNGNEDAPYCSDCHEVHNEKDNEDVNSPTFARNIPDLCGRCHGEGEVATISYKGTQHEIIRNYRMSIHGKGLLESGLLVTATCVDCHTSHSERPASDPLSAVNPKNIGETCAVCHQGIYEQFQKSIHSPLLTETDQDLPVCSSCHASHTIARVDQGDFRQGILDQCGRCHMEVTETYFETFHGKVSKLGSDITAKCYDCHGSHDILPVSNPESRLSRENVIETCRGCHPNSNRKFVGYLTHATHHNRDRYPYLYYTFWFMTILLVGVFTFFGIHTALWLPRALKERANGAAESVQVADSLKGRYYERFDGYSRILHLMVITSFLTLAITGMTIKFADVGIFQVISRLIGGYEVSGFLHRVAAIITFAYFAMHIGYLVQKVRRREWPVKRMLIGENTLMFRKEDIFEFIGTIKWFLGIGPRPDYGRWTYWEKFDYFAVFWGVTIIGFSGLLLWFSEFFTNLGIPGWVINVATIIHSDEALLATGSIFTVHFFNTHFRPDKFPMDPVIFTGRVPVEELKHDRPREYSIAIQNRVIRDKLRDAPPEWLEKAARVFGFTCLGIGLFIVVLIIYSMLFVYQ
ncbi:MAG: hypothetical protein JSU96_03785 [Acidobacteriota bacterium]|nr:MAG: hypothetical protein JSU96_03785 [Acidobacteriota bacterium]